MPSDVIQSYCIVGEFLPSESSCERIVLSAYDSHHHLHLLFLKAQNSTLENLLAWMACSEVLQVALAHKNSPAQVFEQIHNLLGKLFPEGQTVRAAYWVFSQETQHAQYCCAGLHSTLGDDACEQSYPNIGGEAEESCAFIFHQIEVPANASLKVFDPAKAVLWSWDVFSIMPQASEPLSCSLTITLGAQQLRTLYPLPFFMSLFSESPGLKKHASVLYTLLGELFSNSLEHGILKIDSSLKASVEGMVKYYEEREKALAALTKGQLSISLEHQYNPQSSSGTLSIQIDDHGTGFDVATVLENLKNPNQKQYFGRGITLIDSLCHDLQFDNHGARVKALYCYPLEEDSRKAV